MAYPVSVFARLRVEAKAMQFSSRIPGYAGKSHLAPHSSVCFRTIAFRSRSNPHPLPEFNFYLINLIQTDKKNKKCTLFCQ
jgi:hypothetical protein